MHPSRRRVLGTVAAGASAVLVGCTAFQGCTYTGTLVLSAGNEDSGNVVDLDDRSLSESQRDVLEGAIDGGYEACVDDPSPAFGDLIRLIFDLEDAQRGASEPRPVVYEDTRYVAAYRVVAK